MVRQLRSYVNKGQALWLGLAWLPVVWEQNNLLLKEFLSGSIFLS